MVEEVDPQQAAAPESPLVPRGPRVLPSASPSASGLGRVLTALRWVAFAGCVALFVHALAKSDLYAAWSRIRSAGGFALLVLVPFPLVLGADAWAWKGLLSALDRKVPWFTLFKVRIATEAITNSAPVG